MSRIKLQSRLIFYFIFITGAALGETRKWHESISPIFDRAVERSKRSAEKEGEEPVLTLEAMEADLEALKLPPEIWSSLNWEDSNQKWLTLYELKRFAGQLPGMKANDKLLSYQIAVEQLAPRVNDKELFEVGIKKWIAVHPEWEKASAWLKYSAMSDRELLKKLQDPTLPPKESGFFQALANNRWKGWHTKILDQKDLLSHPTPWRKTQLLMETLISAEDYFKNRDEWIQTKGFSSLPHQAQIEKRRQLILKELEFRRGVPIHLKELSERELQGLAPFWVADAPKGSRDLIRNILHLLESKSSDGSYLPAQNTFEVLTKKISVREDGLFSREASSAFPVKDKHDEKITYNREAVFLPEFLKSKVAIIVCADGNCHDKAMENDLAWAEHNKYRVKSINSKKQFMAASNTFRKEGYPILVIQGHSGPINGIQLTNKHAEKEENFNKDSLLEIAPSLTGYQCIIALGCRAALHPDFGPELARLTDSEFWANDFYVWSTGDRNNPNIGSVEVNSHWHVHRPKERSPRLLKLLEPPPKAKPSIHSVRPYPNLGPLFIRLNPDGST